MKLDFTGLAQRLLISSETLGPQWLPGGRRRGHEWVCGDLSGGEGTSLSVNLLSGKWADFATSDRGGDLISLYAAIHELPIPPEPTKRPRREPSPTEPRQPSEAEILRAILQLLRRNPKVALCWRPNSGTFQERNRDGSVRYIRANTARGMSDIMGALKDGRTLAIEVKSRTGRMRPGQEEFLQQIRAAGGVAGVCRSVEDAQKLLGDA